MGLSHRFGIERLRSRATSLTLFCLVASSAVLYSLPATTQAPSQTSATQTVNGKAVARTAGIASVRPDGSANYDIPLWAAPGRASVEPELALHYNSYRGNGTLGVGWSLTGLSQITRCKRTVAQDGFVQEVTFSDGDNGDRYCLDGERLVPISSPLGTATNDADGTVYRKELDNHSKIVLREHDDLGPTSFVVFLKNGEILTYGRDSNSRFEGQRVSVTLTQLTNPQGLPAGLTQHADYSQRVRFAWMLSRIEDRSGNYLDIKYQENNVESYAYEMLPVSIAYTGSTTSGLAPTHEINFKYNYRPDYEEFYVGGLRLLQTDLLSEIDATYAPTNASITLERSYKLSYATSSTSGRSLLDSVQECDGTGICALPSTFTYSVNPLVFSDTTPASIQAGSPIGVPGCPSDFSPYFSGLQSAHGPANDVVVVNPIPPNCQFFSIQETLPGMPTPLPILPPRLADLAGTGQDTAISYLINPAGSTFINSGIPQLGVSLQYENYCQFTSQAFAFDIEGIGRPDIIETPCIGGVATGGMLRRWQGGANGGFGDFIPITGLTQGPGIPGASPAWYQPQYGGAGGVLPPAGRIIDLNGSGRLDLLVPAEPAGGEYNPVGIGYFKGQPTVDATTILDPYGGYSRCSLFLDLDGDGLLDFVSLNASIPPAGAGSATTVNISMNSGHGFLPPVTWQIPSGYRSSPSLMCDEFLGNYGLLVGDMTGEGKQGLILMAGDSPGGQIAYFKPNINVLGFQPITLSVAAGDSSPASHQGFIGSSAPPQWPATVALDSTGDGLTDLVLLRGSTLHLYTQQGPKGDLLIGATDGFGDFANVSYTPASNRAVNVPGVDCDYPISCLGRGVWLATRLTASNGSAPPCSYSYVYGDGIVEKTGRGWIGFRNWTEVDESRGAKTSVEFDTDRRIGSFYPCSSIPKAITWTVPVYSISSIAPVPPDSQGLLHRRVIVSTCRVIFDPSGRSYFSYADTTTTSDWDRQPTGTLALVAQNTTHVDQDIFGNVTNEETDLYQVQNGHPVGRPIIQAAVNRYENFDETWLIGQTVSSDVRSTTPSGETATRRVNYARDPKTGVVSEIRRVSPDFGSGEQEKSCPDDFCLTVRLVRDEYGMIVASDEAGSGQHRRTAFQYDASHSFLTLVTDPVGLARTFQYDLGTGDLTGSIDPNGNATYYNYDGLQRLVEILPPDHASVGIGYGLDSSNNPQVEWVPRGQPPIAVSFDPLGREITRIWRGFSGGVAQSTTYDSLGRLGTKTVPAYVQTNQPPPNLFTFTYDNLDRPLTLINPDGSVRSWSYNGQTINFVNEIGNKSYLTLDPLGRVQLSANFDASGHDVASKLEYGPFGTLTKITDPSGHSSRNDYDQLGRRVRAQTFDAGVLVTKYDAYNEITSQTDGNGVVTSFTFDEASRLIGKTSPDGTWSYIWDKSPNGLGKIRSTTSADGVATQYSYDTLSRVQSETFSVNGTSYSYAYGFDSFGRPSTLTYPTIDGFGLALKYVYASDGYLYLIEDAASGKPFWTVTGRNASGKLTSELFGNNVSTTRSYDAMQRLSSISATFGSSALQNIAYKYNVSGELIERIDAVAGTDELFEYDPLNRLTLWGVKENGGSVSTSYTYNDIGNLLDRNVFSGLIRGPNSFEFFTYGGSNAGEHALTKSVANLFANNYSYDHAGNQIAGPNRNVSYNSIGLPKTIDIAIPGSIPSDQKFSFMYDANGRRALKSFSNSSSTTYAGSLFERRINTGGILDVFYVMNRGRPLAVVYGSALNNQTPATTNNFVHRDVLGSSDTVSNVAGQSVNVFKYDPFGTVRDPSSLALPADLAIGALKKGFTAHEHDDEFDLINMRGRIYDPVAAHFLTPDPIIARPLFSQSYNSYSYVFNSPLSFTDPTGYDGGDGDAAS